MAILDTHWTTSKESGMPIMPEYGFVQKKDAIYLHEHTEYTL